MLERIALELDPDDYATIQEELADRRRNIAAGWALPDGDSNEEGAIIAECIRDLVEYRHLWESEHPQASSKEPT